MLRYSSLSIQDANHLKAYNGFLGITVAQHFYVRHRIRLQHYDLHCFAEYTLEVVHCFPLELLELILPIYIFDGIMVRMSNAQENRRTNDDKRV